MTTTQHIRLMDPTRKGHVLSQFATRSVAWREVLADALSGLHPSWSNLSHMEMMLEVWEDGKWEPYL